MSQLVLRSDGRSRGAKNYHPKNGSTYAVWTSVIRASLAERKKGDLYGNRSATPESLQQQLGLDILGFWEFGAVSPSSPLADDDYSTARHLKRCWRC
jgi:hypothetical protein